MHAFPDIPGIVFLTAQEAQRRYGVDTGGAERSLQGAAIVQHRAAVKRLVEVAIEQGWKLWPVSGGRNFGYGTSLPV